MALDMLRQCVIDKCANYTAAGTTAITGDILDMQGFENVCFVGLTGDVTATCVLGLTGYYDNTDAAMGSEAACTTACSFTAGATDADNKLMVLDCKRIPGRYVRAKITRTTANAVIDGMIAIRYNEHDAPVTASGDVIDDEESVGGA